MMSLSSKIKSRLAAPRLFILDIFNVVAPILPDRAFLRIRFRIVMGRRLDLECPRTYNEKLQWLKLYDRRPIYTTMVDKLAVKEYVAGIIGQEYVIPAIGSWNSPEEIDFSTLPSQFVLKTTHEGDSSGVFICRDSSTFDVEKVKDCLRKNLKRKYYRLGREWPYKNVVPRIIAEPYLEDGSGELRDYKFFCFDGKVKALFVATGRSKGDVRFDYFDRDFNHLDLEQSHPVSDIRPGKPAGYERMIQIAESLAAGFPHIRIDLYNCDGTIYFGEMTLYHYGGMTAFHPDEWDSTFGEWLQLPPKSKA